MDWKEIDQKYKERGLTTEHGADPAGKHYEPHRHEETVLYTVSGSIKVKLDDKKWKELKAGDELIVGEQQLHEAIVGPDGWEYVAGSFEGDVE